MAEDEAGNRSPVSNLAPAYVVEVTTTTQMEISFKVVNGSSNSDLSLAGGVYTTDADPGKRELVNRETMLYLVAAAIVAFVVVLSAVFFAAVYRANKRRRGAGANSSHSDHDDDLDFDPKDLISPPIHILNPHSSGSATSTSTLPDIIAPEKDGGPPNPVWKAYSVDAVDLSGPVSWPYPVAVSAHDLAAVANQPYYSNIAALQQGGAGQPVSLVAGGGAAADYSSLLTTAAARMYCSPPQHQPPPPPPVSLHHHPHQSVVGLPLQEFNSSSEMASSSNSPTDYVRAGEEASTTVAANSSSSNSNGRKASKSKKKGGGERDSGFTASTDCSTDSDQVISVDDNSLVNLMKFHWRFSAFSRTPTRTCTTSPAPAW